MHPCLTKSQNYAPTLDYDDDDGEDLHEELENTIKKTPKKDLVILGDWNTKIGYLQSVDWDRGHHGLGETNDSGMRLLEFVTSHKLTLVDALFSQKISRTTWHVPHGLTCSQTDIILAAMRFKSRINKAKVINHPGADISSDHNMVLMTLKINLKKNQKQGAQCITFNMKNCKT